MIAARVGDEQGGFVLFYRRGSAGARDLGRGGGFLTLHKGGACVLADARLGSPGAEHRRDVVMHITRSPHEGGVSIIPGIDIRTAIIKEVFNRRQVAVTRYFTQSNINIGS